MKRTKVSDGVFTFDKVEIDTTKPRNMPAVSELFAGLSTQSRIEKLEAFANAADATDPAVALRLSRMRDYIGEAGEGAIDGRYGRAGLALIGRAEQMRREIAVLPLALAAKGSRKGSGKGGRTRAQQLQDEAAEWQAKIKAEAMRMIRRGMSLRSIGTRLAPDTAINGRLPVTAGQVRDYASLLRKALPKK